MSVVLMVVLVGFAALSIDVGYLYTVKAEAQNAADSAARAGASVFLDDTLRQVSGGGEPTALDLEAATRTSKFAAQNTVRGTAPVFGDADVAVGLYDFDNPTAPLTLGGAINAVQVMVRYESNSANGAVPNLFAQVFGFKTTDVNAEAIAAIDDRFAGYTPGVPGVLTPFTIEMNEYETQLAGGQDNLSYDAGLDAVQSFADGIPEIALYPYAENDGGDGAGNFGMLNIGVNNMGVPGLSGQILNGVTATQLADEIGTEEISFFDSAGDPITYQITGNPGVQAAIEPEVEARVGDLIGFFVHSQLVQGGSNAVYTIVKLRFGRVMEVVLTGDPSQRRIVIQPSLYSDPGVRTDPNAGSSGGFVGQVYLVR